jgi:hypothetical protein
MRAVVLFIVTLMVCGCGIARQIEQEENDKKADAALAAARAVCQNRAKTGEIKGQLGFTECDNAAQLAWWQTRDLPHVDLLQLKNAKLAAIAAEFDRGRMDATQLKLANAQVASEVMSMFEQRTAMRSQAAAAMIQASAAQQMAGPRTCQTFGNSVTCY